MTVDIFSRYGFEASLAGAISHLKHIFTMGQSPFVSATIVAQINTLFVVTRFIWHTITIHILMCAISELFNVSNVDRFALFGLCAANLFCVGSACRFYWRRTIGLQTQKKRWWSICYRMSRWFAFGLSVPGRATSAEETAGRLARRKSSRVKWGVYVGNIKY